MLNSSLFQARVPLSVANDALRQGKLVRGSVLLTSGLWARGTVFVAEVLEAVAKFSDFNIVNDPYGEHDFGVVRVSGEEIVFKIDYHDLTMTRAASDPHDMGSTHRVLTIMLASDR